MRNVVLKIIVCGFWACYTQIVMAKNLTQATEHDYVTERYYLGIDSNKKIESNMRIARANADQIAQMKVVCVDMRQFYKAVIALNQANRHFNPNKIDADTKTYRALLKDIEQPNYCKQYGF
jgi:hypothetical protein